MSQTGANSAVCVAAHDLMTTLAILGMERVQQLVLQSGIVETSLTSKTSWDEKEAALGHVRYSHRCLEFSLRKKWVGHLVDMVVSFEDEGPVGVALESAVDFIVHRLELLVSAVDAGDAGSNRQRFAEAFAKLEAYLSRSASPQLQHTLGRFLHYYA